MTGKRSRRIHDVPVPRSRWPLSLAKPPRPEEVEQTDDDVWKSEITSIVRSTDPLFYDVLDLARKPLPSIREADRILDVAERSGQLDESVEPLVAAGLVEPPRSTEPVKFLISSPPREAALAAAAGEHVPVWRVTNDSFGLSNP